MPDVGALQRQHPEWRIVDAIDRPDGGIWAVGADGGVFALDAQGNPDNGPMFGSYPGLAPEQRMGDRAFVRIEADPETGGYTLVGNDNARYRFLGATRPQGPAVPPPPAAPPPNSDAELNTLRSLLVSRGLGALLDSAWNYYKGPGGGSADATYTWLTTTPEYEQRYPGMKHLRDTGQAWTEAQYQQYEETVMQEAERWGLPADFVDRDDIGKMIQGNKSVNEVRDNLQMASEAVFGSPDALAWAQENFGVDASGLMAYYLDTEGKGPSFLERQHRQAQMGIGGAARGVGFGSISAAEAARLQQAGLSPEQARGAFGQVAGMHALFEETLAEETTGAQLGREEQIGLVAGEAGAEEQVRRRRAQREATFGGGGGATAGGLGSAGQR